MDYEVRGLEQLDEVARAFKAAGVEGKALRRELTASLNRATQGTREDMKESIPQSFPTRGGLARSVEASAKFSTSTSSSARSLGVRIRARGRGALAMGNAQGMIRKPVFGNRKVWRTQTAGVHKGFLDEAFEKSKPKVQDAVLDAIAKVASQIYRRT